MTDELLEKTPVSNGLSKLIGIDACLQTVLDVTPRLRLKLPTGYEYIPAFRGLLDALDDIDSPEPFDTGERHTPSCSVRILSDPGTSFLEAHIVDIDDFEPTNVYCYLNNAMFTLYGEGDSILLTNPVTINHCVLEQDLDKFMYVGTYALAAPTSVPDSSHQEDSPAATGGGIRNSLAVSAVEELCNWLDTPLHTVMRLAGFGQSTYYYWRDHQASFLRRGKADRLFRLHGAIELLTDELTAREIRRWWSTGDPSPQTLLASDEEADLVAFESLAMNAYRASSSLHRSQSAGGRVRVLNDEEIDEALEDATKIEADFLRWETHNNQD